MPTEFTIIAEYSFDGKIVKENSIIDLRSYLGADIPLLAVGDLKRYG